MSKVEKLYLNETEAAYRYGYSKRWFQRERWKGTGPEFGKVNGGRVLYPLEKTDIWFQSFEKTQPVQKTK